MKDFLELAAQRYSCRKFSDKPVEEEKIRKILQAATLAPTAKNGQPQHVIVVRSDEMRKKMKEASPCTFDAPVIFVMCGDVKSPVLYPAFSNIEAVILLTEPFPFVPATCTYLRLFCGFPISSRSLVIRSSPGCEPNTRSESIFFIASS